MSEARSPFRAHAKHRAISPPPPSRQGRLFPAVLREPMISLCALRESLLCRPVELGPVDPHAVQNDRELARDGDFGLAEPVALSQPNPPGLQGRPFLYASEQHIGGFEQICAEHSVAALRDSAGPIDLSGGVAPSCQSNIGAYTSRSLKARRIVDRRLEAECGDRADTGTVMNLRTCTSRRASL